MGGPVGYLEESRAIIGGRDGCIIGGAISRDSFGFVDEGPDICRTKMIAVFIEDTYTGWDINEAADSR